MSVPSKSTTAHLASLREHRVRGERELGLATDVAALRDGIERRERAIGGVSEAWGSVVPAGVGDSAELVGVRRGVLSVRVRDAAARHALDRFLRSGGLDRLIKACPVSLTRVAFVR